MSDPFVDLEQLCGAIPRQLDVVGTDGQHQLVSRPAAEVRRGIRPLGRDASHRQVWHSRRDRALVVTGHSPTHVGVEGQPGASTTVELGGGLLTVERQVPGDDLLSQRFEAPVEDDRGELIVVIDHGTLEVFAAGGSTTMSLLTFTGSGWSATVDGAVELAQL